MARQSVRLTDQQWSHIEPLLPRMPRGGTGGRPWVDHRDVIDGILWVLKTGARWRDLPEGYPAPRPAGDGWDDGRRTELGCGSGGPSSASWM